MKLLNLAIGMFLFLAAPIWAQSGEAAAGGEEDAKAVSAGALREVGITTRAEEKTGGFVDDGTRVSILGYHDFSATLPETEMRISTDKFRHQMQVIKELNLSVISLAQFCDWKSGDGRIPTRSVLITIDDGWRSVYEEAWPILREYEFPFTLFLYKNYVDSGGKSLSKSMIEEMVSSGLCSIGSHSVSHPYPSNFKKVKKQGVGAYVTMLQTEFRESRAFLEEVFECTVDTYAYPGGYHTPEMFPVAKAAGYRYLFAVEPGKTGINTKNHIIPRYIILATHDRIFERALIFRSGKRSLILPTTLSSTPAYPVEPKAGAKVANRQPRISIDLSAVNDLDFEKIEMIVQGFGKVEADFALDTKVLSWSPFRPIRAPVCEVSVSWKTPKDVRYSTPVKWVFHIEREASYQIKYHEENQPHVFE